MNYERLKSVLAPGVIIGREWAHLCETRIKDDNDALDRGNRLSALLDQMCDMLDRYDRAAEAAGIVPG